MNSNRRYMRRASVLAPIAFIAACATAYVAPADRTDTVAASGGHTDHVIIVSIDGLRPDAIERFNARTLQRLMEEGAWSLEATTITPSITLPSHTSMLTGLEAEAHGVTWNTEDMDTHGHILSPTIFTAAKRAGLHTAAFFSKVKFQHLAVPGTLDHVQVPTRWPGMAWAESTIDHMKRYLRTARPNLLFVHFADPDLAGHMFGWMSRPYGSAVRTVDAKIDELVSIADHTFGAGNYTLIVTADHGGHGRSHDTDDPRNVQIPWIAWGEGVAAGTELPAGIRTIDSAATVLWLLGIDAREEITGRAVTAAFDVR
ncbi:MAG: alkaline phosphatase family protein [Gemmatimonadetes bacterium]|nr:alkaline phosphatase family protein [Gemmatimonadota bacterium]